MQLQCVAPYANSFIDYLITKYKVVAMQKRCSSVTVGVQHAILMMRHNYSAINHREMSSFSGPTGWGGEES